MNKDVILCQFYMNFKEGKNVHDDGYLTTIHSMNLELPVKVAPNVGDIIELGGLGWRADLKVKSRQFGATVLEDSWEYYYNYELEEVGDLNNKEIRDVQEEMAGAECIMVNQAMQEHRYQVRGVMTEKTINDISNIFDEDELF